MKIKSTKKGGSKVTRGGCSIPESLAKLIARRAYKMRKRRPTYTDRTSYSYILHYYNRGVYFHPSGAVEIGCQYVYWSEISRIGRKRGWFKGLR